MPDEVLLREAFCSGYVDSIGNWNNGFACPARQPEPMFCCGTATYRYCCPARRQGREAAASDGPGHSSLSLILGVVFGVLISAVLVITALCLFWRSWRAYRKRPRSGGHLFCVTGGGGTSPFSGPLSGHSSRVGSPQSEEDALQPVDEVAVTPPRRLGTPLAAPPRPTSFTGDRASRALLSDFSDNSSNSSDTELSMGQLYINVAGRQPPPAYSLNNHALRTLSLAPPERVGKFDPECAANDDELTACRYDRSRSSSLFKSTRF